VRSSTKLDSVMLHNTVAHYNCVYIL